MTNRNENVTLPGGARNLFRFTDYSVRRLWNEFHAPFTVDGLGRKRNKFRAPFTHRNKFRAPQLCGLLNV